MAQLLFLTYFQKLDLLKQYVPYIAKEVHAVHQRQEHVCSTVYDYPQITKDQNQLNLLSIFSNLLQHYKINLRLFYLNL